MTSRLVEQVIKGERVWVEADRPTDCPARHGRIGAAWRACDLCGTHCRHWPCMADECDYVRMDPEHDCRHGPPPSSALRGA